MLAAMVQQETWTLLVCVGSFSSAWTIPMRTGRGSETSGTEQPQVTHRPGPGSLN